MLEHRKECVLLTPPPTLSDEIQSQCCCGGYGEEKRKKNKRKKKEKEIEKPSAGSWNFTARRNLVAGSGMCISMESAVSPRVGGDVTTGRSFLLLKANSAFWETPQSLRMFYCPSCHGGGVWLGRMQVSPQPLGMLNCPSCDGGGVWFGWWEASDADW